MNTTPNQKTTRLQTNPKRTTKQPKMPTQTPTELALAAAKAQLDENAAEIRGLTEQVREYHNLTLILKEQRNEAILKVRCKDDDLYKILADKDELHQQAEAHRQRADFLADQLRNMEFKIQQLEDGCRTESKGCCDGSEPQKVRDKEALLDEMLADNEALRQQVEAHCQRADFIEDQLRDREAKIRQLEAEGQTKSKDCCDDSEPQKVREYYQALFLFNSYGLFNDHWGQPYDFTDEVEQPLLFCVRRTLAGYLQNEGVKMYKEALQNFKYKSQKGQEP